ncbi:MAG: peroxiredoxin, partial [Conexivisphaerales archaeon]
KWLVLYFYPRDDTPGCTAEACNFRDSSHELQKLGASVVGVSTDTPESHKNFSNKYRLSFPLLSDPSGEFGASLGVLRDSSRPTMNRVTFIIDPNGIVRKVYPRL